MDEDLSSVPESGLFAQGFDQAGLSLPSTSGYAPLPGDSIRLLEILSTEVQADEPGIISCRLTQHSIDQAPSYHALSYAWGSKPENCLIDLDGRRVFVRKNLWRLLCEAKDVSAPSRGLLWVDALCINQDDARERAQQVSLMAQIYRNASSVLVWLGPAYGGSIAAMDGLCRYAACRRPRNNIWKITGKDAGIAIGILCRRPYWTRLWVFQELTLAPKITLMCGHQRAPWEPLREILLDGSLLPQPDSRYAKTSRTQAGILHQIILQSPALSMVSEIFRQSNETSLFDRLITMQQLSCQDPRDRVYALLGVTSRGCSSIRPDYETDIPSLLNVVLRNHHAEVAQPKDISTIERQCRQLGGVFGDPECLFDLTPGSSSYLTPSSQEAARYPLRPKDTQVSLWWAAHYGHSSTQIMLTDMLADEIPSILAHAVSHGNSATVALLLNAGADVNFEEQNRACNYVYQAATRGDETIVRLLLTKGANPNSRDRHRTHGEDYAICAASNGGHYAVVRLLIDYGAELDACGGRAVRMASKGGHTRIVELLLARGANAVAKGGSEFSESALCIASKRGHADVVKLLLRQSMDKGIAKVFELDRVRAVTVASGEGYLKIVRLLLERSSCKRSGSSQSTTLEKADHYAMLDEALRDFDFSMFEEAPDYTDAVSAAALRGHIDIIKLLISHDTRFRLGDARGLRAASAAGHIAIVELLLDRCDDVGSMATSALYAASENGHEQLVRILLDKGADVNAEEVLGERNNRGLFPLEGASRKGHAGVGKLLLQRGASRGADDALCVAAGKGYEEIVRLLLDAGADANSTGGEDGENALYVASAAGHTDIVRLLLDHGAIVAARYSGYALHAACKAGHLRVVHLLLERGADPNATDWNNESCPDAAARNGYTDVARALQSKGARDSVDEYLHNPPLPAPVVFEKRRRLTASTNEETHEEDAGIAQPSTWEEIQWNRTRHEINKSSRQWRTQTLNK